LIVLDTNVVSEAMRPTPSPVVRAWLNAQVANTLYLSSVSLAELLFGITALADGRRKYRLADALNGILEIFDDRILSFDTEAARHYADRAAKAQVEGRSLPVLDGYIAAIAAAQGFTVASRDVSPFEAAGVPVINPWESS
jgi:predicted nucleic acid-binding protein